MNATELKKQYNKLQGGYFFNPKTMKYFGDTMGNYKVINPKDSDYYQLSRKNAVKNGLQSSCYFHKETLKHYAVLPLIDPITAILKKEFNTPLLSRVLNEVIEDSENYKGNTIQRLKARLTEVEKGCVSGTVSSLISYDDTSIFFTIYKYEILELKKEYKFTVPEFDTLEEYKNTMAWFAYEVIASRINDFLEEL